MQGRLIFLLEEPSMKIFLEGLLPRLFPGWVEREHFLCVSHQGKSDLDLSIPRKLRAWHYPDDRFVIVRDNDNANCTELKSHLLQVCQDSGRRDTLVRLVCQELEGWYLGDLKGLADAYNNPRLNNSKNAKRFVNPDDWQKPSVEVVRMIPEFQKGSGARRMGIFLNSADHNTSKSFKVFIAGLERIAMEMGWKFNS